jgi:hypothetical protein
MNEREREKVWQCHVCSSQQVACMLADCRDGGGGGGLVAVLSERKPLHCPWGQGRAGIFIARVQGKSSFYQL